MPTVGPTAAHPGFATVCCVNPPQFDARAQQATGFRLRDPEPADIDAIARACADPLTQRWLPLPNPYRRSDAAWFVEVFAPEQLGTGDGIVRVIEVEGRLAGVIDLKKTDWRAGTTEIGYWVAPSHRGQRLAGRASSVLADWAMREQGMQRVEIRVAVGNVGSARSAVAAGFRYEGCLRSAGFTHDGRVDLQVYGRTAADLA